LPYVHFTATVPFLSHGFRRRNESLSVIPNSPAPREIWSFHFVRAASGYLTLPKTTYNRPGPTDPHRTLGSDFVLLYILRTRWPDSDSTLSPSSNAAIIPSTKLPSEASRPSFGSAPASPMSEPSIGDYTVGWIYALQEALSWRPDLTKVGRCC
jgi:hypothetical protein